METLTDDLQILKDEPLFNHQTAQSSFYLMQLLVGCMRPPQQCLIQSAEHVLSGDDSLLHIMARHLP